MKKFTLIAAAAMTAMAASAQYNVEPASNSQVIDKATKGMIVDYLILSDNAISSLEKAGATLNYVGPNDAGHNLYIWDGELQTFIAGDATMPRLDMEEGDYVSLIVSDKNWSGAGYNIGKTEPIDISHLNDQTHFHFAYMSPNNNAPASVALILLNGDEKGSAPASISVGNPFVDNGSIYPAVGKKMTDEWQVVDITLGDIKKIGQNLQLMGQTSWTGNIVAFLGGGVQGQGIAFDAMYFYTPAAEGSINEVGADNNVFFTVTENTINVNGGQGIVLYNIAGQTVKATSGSVLGINNLPAGIYVAKSGNKAQKVVVK